MQTTLYVKVGGYPFKWVHLGKEGEAFIVDNAIAVLSLRYILYALYGDSIDVPGTSTYPHLYE